MRRIYAAQMALALLLTVLFAVGKPETDPGSVMLLARDDIPNCPVPDCFLSFLLEVEK